MTWVRIDDAILDNRKILRVGVLGFALHVAATTHCARNLTDGFLDDRKLGGLLDLEGLAVATEVATRLVNAELWERVNEGYMVHDYLAYNPSRADVLAERARLSVVRSDAGRKGGFARWQKDGQTNIELANVRQTTAPVPVPVPMGTIPLAMSSLSKRVPTAELIKERIDLAKEVGYLWKAHKGWAAWPKEERGQWWTIVRYVKQRPYPIEFWEWLIPTISKDVNFAYITKSPEPGVCCLAEERHGYWREEQWLEQKAAFTVPAEIATMIEPFVRPKVVSWQ